MARSLAFSGAQACTPGTDHVLQTWTAPTGGATYALVLDVAALANGEYLRAYVERATRSTDTRRELFRISVGAHANGGVTEIPYFGAAAGVELRVGIQQVGGTGRTIPWVIERVDG